jgi:hypothetical protein
VTTYSSTSARTSSRARSKTSSRKRREGWDPALSLVRNDLIGQLDRRSRLGGHARPTQARVRPGRKRHLSYAVATHASACRRCGGFCARGRAVGVGDAAGFGFRPASAPPCSSSNPTLDRAAGDCACQPAGRYPTRARSRSRRVGPPAHRGGAAGTPRNQRVRDNRRPARGHAGAPATGCSRRQAARCAELPSPAWPKVAAASRPEAASPSRPAASPPRPAAAPSPAATAAPRPSAATTAAPRPSAASSASSSASAASAAASSSSSSSSATAASSATSTSTSTALTARA